MRALALALLLLAAGAAQAQTRRLAVVVGNNTGGGARPPLRYAEADAAKVASVLVELGDVRADDLVLLQAQGAPALRRALQAARTKAERWQEREGARTILVFYFSGHSDGTSLELGRDRVGYKELRAWLEETRAAVRVAVVDSCSSGALLAAKGGVPGPSFDIRLSDALDSSGHALLTSSAANELALESRELGGSFFTHHLVSGLRGAADASGDGRVTLGEAYQYAFVHTLSSTADTFVGGQHPAYDFELSGQGDFVLTHLSRHRALLTLPEGVERALVTEAKSGAVVAEVSAGARTRLAVPAGAYTVRAWQGGRAHRGGVTLAPGEERALQWAQLPLAPAGAGGTLHKGGVWREPALPGVLSLGVGARRAALGDVGSLSQLHLGLRSAGPSGLLLGLALGSGTQGPLRERGLELSAGWRWGVEQGDVGVFAGGEVRLQAGAQELGAGASTWALNPAAGPMVGAALQVVPAWTVELRAHAPVALLRLDGTTRLRVQPGGWLGLGWSFR